MDYIRLLFVEHSALQAIIVLSLISAVGVLLGRIKLFGISLGTAFIFFVGILAGHLGLSIDPQMLKYAESFGLVLFVYALGLQVGPGFFASMRTEGVRLLGPSLAVLAIGTLLAVGLSFACGVPISDMAGILCGATTNTPALGAAQQTLEQLGKTETERVPACAVYCTDYCVQTKIQPYSESRGDDTCYNDHAQEFLESGCGEGQPE